MTPAQCRAARALLGITQAQLARAAKLGLSTVVDFEKERRLVSEEAVRSGPLCNERALNSWMKTESGKVSCFENDKNEHDRSPGHPKRH
jgi:hypothetical protein